MMLQVIKRLTLCSRSQVARWNGKPQIHGRILVDDACSSGSGSGSRGRFRDLFAFGRVRLTLSVFFLWFVAASTYYGIVLLSTELLNSDKNVCPTAAAANASRMAVIKEEEQECSVHTCRWDLVGSF